MCGSREVGHPFGQLAAARILLESSTLERETSLMRPFAIPTPRSCRCQEFFGSVFSCIFFSFPFLTGGKKGSVVDGYRWSDF